MPYPVKSIKTLQTALLAACQTSVGKVDGELGRLTNRALDAYVAAIASSRWSTQRLAIARTQAMANLMGINAGKIDGLRGPQTIYAEEQLARLNKGYQKEDFRDHEPELLYPPGKGGDTPYEKDMVKYYGRVGENQTDLILPFKMRLAWDKTTVITKFKIHEKAHDSALRCFNNIANEYEEAARIKGGLDLFGGCLNVRKKRGGSSWSIHSWGAAIDFDPLRNALKQGRDTANLAKPEYETFWCIWESENWFSLGRLRNYDFMHIQRARP